MAQPLQLLVIEDDVALARFLLDALRAEGHAVDLGTSGSEGVTRAVGARYDIIILDLFLRDIHGVELLTRLRHEGVTTSILALGGKIGPAHVVRALDAGADEYVTKPVSAEEIAARVRALARRSAPVPPTVLTLENVAVNSVTHQAFVNGRQLHVTPKEFSLLRMFLRRQGETISREMHFDPGSNVVDVHVSRLRTKLHQARAAVAIEAVRGAGFAFTARRRDQEGESNVVA